MNPHSAFTVDAGHVQLENDVVYLRDTLPFNYLPGSKIETQRYQWVPALRVGILNWLEAGVSANFMEDRIKYDRGPFADALPWLIPYRETVDHYGPDWTHVNFSLKANLIGNDGGRFALAVAPFLSHPTERDMLRYFGVNVPFAWNVTEATRLNLMSGVKFYHYPDRLVAFPQTAQLRHSVCSHFDLYGQFQATFWNEEFIDWWGYAGGGVAFRPIQNLEVQVGCDFLVTESQGDWGPEDMIARHRFRFGIDRHQTTFWRPGVWVSRCGKPAGIPAGMLVFLGGDRQSRCA